MKDLGMLQMLVGKHVCKLLLPMICCGVAACATSGRYKDSLDAWIGSPDSKLIASWGPPAETFESNGHTFLVYQSSKVEPFASTMPNPTGSHADYSVALFCTTVFDISGGLVVSSAIKGNDCAHAGR